ncbi:MAG: exodeoxyribonuclease V subunit beta [Candidatus Accumulibacter sp.]|nr:exodeoxyribonuclease V subunit beta [Accumulibacter sp.]
MNPATPTKPIDLDVFACPLDGLRLIEASAGTGKTWNLCGLYLRLLLERDLEVQQILVVTFTNAATAELRERIRSRIVDVLAYLQRAATASDPFVTQLLAAVERNTGVDRQRMLARLDAALHTFDEAAVFTIHGFCQRALSDTPFAAGLPFKLELLHDDQPLRLEAVSDFWRRQVASAAISPALADYLLQNKDSPETWARLLGRQLAKPRSRVIWPEEMANAQAEINLAGLLDTFERARQLWGGDGAGPTEALLNGLGALNANSYKPDAVQLGALAWQHWLGSGDALNAPDPEASKARLFSARFIGERKKKNQTPPTHPFFDVADDLLAAHASLETALQLARLRLLRQMFEESTASLRQQKRRQRVISFDDMLYNVDAALTAADTPWLAASLRDRYPVALIDEFQDTDPLQFAIFDRIYGATSELPAGPLFFVGDPKQAIYSFRNADLHTYLAARRRAGVPYTLRHNQRSTAALIEACNTLFAANAKAFILPGLDYEAVTLGDKPRPQLRDGSEVDAAALRVWRLPAADGEYLLRAQARQQVLRATAAEVARLLGEAQARRITIGDRPLAPGDIAILVKSHAQGRLTRDALLQLGVGCVELSQQSIFHTPDAEGLERVLLAVLEPGRPALLYAALATELLGFDAVAVAALAADEGRLLQFLSRFSAYRETWLRRGFGVMFRSWLENEAVARRLLARSDGERRLTNLLHLGELLQQADAEDPAPDALLHWLASQRRDVPGDEVAQLRLESDRNLVQIVTIHKAKGLEYGVVFCPFLWDGHPSAAGELEGSEYHDDDGQPVIDFRFDLDDSVAAGIKSRRQQEKDAEFMRLLYVALTRAVYRCYLVAGCYATLSFGNRSLSQSTRSLLNWLVAGHELSYSAWRGHRLPAAAIDAAWQAVADAASPQLSLGELPSAPGVQLAAAELAPESLQALTPPGRIPPGWRIGSFSSLQHGADASASDHDGRVAPSLPAVGRGQAERAPDLAPDDILYFPRGAAAGDCVHALFESIDFTESSEWPGAIEQVLVAYPQSLPGLSASDAGKRLARMLRRLLDDVLATTLPDGIVLAAVPRRHRLVELGFHLPSAAITAPAINRWLQTHGYPLPGLDFPPLSGYLKGFIDLVFCHADRFYVLDWKSNHLGYTPADYGQERMAAAMSEHGYHLQYLLYCVALHRYLRQRIADYDYERDCGGVLYLFVRGVRPAWQAACGVYQHRPSANTIASLDALLTGTAVVTA